MTEEYGLIGYPLGHSFSKNFFNEKFASEGVDAVYNNFEISNIKLLPKLLKLHPDLRGLNVTIPYKQQLLPYLDELSPEAKQIGAVNVVKITHIGNKTHLKGMNSDVVGFKRSIEPLLEPHHKAALVLGTGGAARAIHYGLEQLGVKAQYVSRTKKTGCITYEEITPEVIRQYPVIVNCTPLGMYPRVNECPPLPYEAMDKYCLLYDLIYNPDQTLFLKRGLQHGAVVKNGLEMLLLQAYVSWEMWQ